MNLIKIPAPLRNFHLNSSLYSKFTILSIFSTYYFFIWLIDFILALVYYIHVVEYVDNQ